MEKVPEVPKGDNVAGDGILLHLHMKNGQSQMFPPGLTVQAGLLSHRRVSPLPLS